MVAQRLPAGNPVLPLVRSGKLRALGQTTQTRSAAMADIPTVAESGLPGYVADNWYGIFAPAGTPAPVIARLNAELVKALNDPEVKARLIAAGQDPAPSTPEEMGAALRADIAIMRLPVIWRRGAAARARRSRSWCRTSGPSATLPRSHRRRRRRGSPIRRP